MPDNVETAGKRLGGLLVRRRIELNPAWRNRKAFAAEHRLTYRVVSDLENGCRGNFEPATITGAEVAYRLAPGSLRRSLDSGELEPAPEPRRSDGRFQVSEDTGGQFRESDRSLLRALGVGDFAMVVMGLRSDMRRLEARIAAARAENPAATGWGIFKDDPVLAELWEMDTAPEERLMYMALRKVKKRAESEIIVGTNSALTW